MSEEDTGEYDLITYAYVFEKMEALRLPVFWKITPLKKGVMLILHRSDEKEQMFIASSQAMDDREQTIIDWANGQGL